MVVTRAEIRKRRRERFEERQKSLPHVIDPPPVKPDPKMKEEEPQRRTKQPSKAIQPKRDFVLPEIDKHEVVEIDKGEPAHASIPMEIVDLSSDIEEKENAKPKRSKRSELRKGAGRRTRT